MRISVTEDSPSSTGRSLVPVDGPGGTGAARGAGVYHARPAATFLAQLVAIAQGAPQTRLRRRASPGHAAALYAAAARIARPSAIKISM
jgi:hypothetical protein